MTYKNYDHPDITYSSSRNFEYTAYKRYPRDYGIELILIKDRYYANIIKSGLSILFFAVFLLLCNYRFCPPVSVLMLLSFLLITVGILYKSQPSLAESCPNCGTKLSDRIDNKEFYLVCSTCEKKFFIPKLTAKETNNPPIDLDAFEEAKKECQTFLSYSHIPVVATTITFIILIAIRISYDGSMIIAGHYFRDWFTVSVISFLFIFGAFIIYYNNKSIKCTQCENPMKHVISDIIKSPCQICIPCKRKAYHGDASLLKQHEIVSCYQISDLLSDKLYTSELKRKKIKNSIGSFSFMIIWCGGGIKTLTTIIENLLPNLNLIFDYKPIVSHGLVISFITAVIVHLNKRYSQKAACPTCIGYLEMAANNDTSCIYCPTCQIRSNWKLN